MAVASNSSSAIFFSSASSNPQNRRRTPPSLLRAAVSPRQNVWPPRASSSSHSSRRHPNFPPETVVVVSDAGRWREIKALNEEEYVSDGDYEDYEGEEEDRSLDLLVRFLHNVFRNISRRVRKAVRSVLPVPIPTKLVGFSVDGMLVLAFLWILKAFLEVVCTLGSMVFISILLVRGVWSGVSYFQETRSDQRSRFNNDDDRAWSGVQAAT